MKLANMMTIHIATARKTQKQVADEIGISTKALARMSAGKPVDQFATLKIIAWLFEEEG